MAFNDLKRRSTTAPILTHADPSRRFVLEIDGSEFDLGAVLSQEQSDEMLHPVAYYTRKFTPSEINYKIYNKETLAIVASFELWCNYLYRASNPTTIVRIGILDLIIY